MKHFVGEVPVLVALELLLFGLCGSQFTFYQMKIIEKERGENVRVFWGARELTKISTFRFEQCWSILIFGMGGVALTWKIVRLILGI